MKLFKSKYAVAASILSTGLALLAGGCKADSEFDKDDEGLLRLQLVVNSNVTRALENEDYLRANCVLYISNEKGLLYKYKGLENVPSEIHLKNGNYVAEAWSGDSVGASFDKKFFRGYEPFNINGGQTSVVVKCKIANVVGSINHSSIDTDVMKDWQVTFSHSRASLDINEETQAEKGYFMMPKADKDLHYKVTGTRADGQPFVKEGDIPNVQRAHEYVLNFSYTPDDSQIGGAFIKIIIDDQLVEENSDVAMYSKPSIKGENFDIENQLIGNPGAFTGDAIVKTSAFGDLTELIVSTPDYAAIGFPAQTLNLLDLAATPMKTLNDLGVTWDKAYSAERNMTTSFLTLGKKFLNSLEGRDTQYTLSITAKDSYGKTNTAEVNIAVGEGAIIYSDPVIAEEIDAADQMAVLSHSAVIPVSITDASASNPRVEYREYGTEPWQSQPIIATRAAVSSNVVLSGLKPATRYEYRAATDEFAGEAMYFTTEGTFTIPNAGMEAWSNCNEEGKSGVLVPSADGSRTFWDSGNHGSSTMGVNITQSTDSPVHSGSKAAKLASQFVGIGSIGKFAAGNIFAGQYLETVGTDGRISFGRPYDGSHPSHLRVWANYRPGVGVNKKGANASYIAVDQEDLGEIYIALATEPYEVFTKKGADQRLFNPTDPTVLAYGHYVFEGRFGADGALQQLDIPFEYYTAARSRKPLYLIIVCTASKYGDYFSGGEGSTLAVDDFELLYNN